MKANEWRLGNELEQGTVIFIKSDFVKTCNEIVETHNLPEHFTPLLITKEILLKFGFKIKIDYDQEATHYGLESKSNTRRALGVYMHSDMWFVTFREDVGCGWSDLNEVEYVHQLQNLYFALMGEELIFTI